MFWEELIIILACFRDIKQIVQLQDHNKVVCNIIFN
jgi:hypothetical protein